MKVIKIVVVATAALRGVVNVVLLWIYLINFSIATEQNIFIFRDGLSAI